MERVVRGGPHAEPCFIEVEAFLKVLAFFTWHRCFVDQNVIINFLKPVLAVASLLNLHTAGFKMKTPKVAVPCVRRGRSRYRFRLFEFGRPRSCHRVLHMFQI